MRVGHFFRNLSRTALAGAGVVAAVALVLTGVLGQQGAKAAPTDVVATGAGEGGSPHIRAFSPDGAVSDVNFYARGTGSSGAYVAAGDIDGDGAQELVTAGGPGSVATLAVSRKDATVLADIVPFPGSNGGATVAAGNVDASDAQEVIVGSGPGMASQVKAYRLVNDQLQEVFSFAPYPASFTGGIFVGAANGFIVTGAGAGGGPHVKVFKISGGVPELFSEWFAYGEFPGGVRVAIGNAQVPGKLNVVTGAGPGGGPHVRIFNTDGLPLYEFFAFSPNFKGGVTVGIAGEARTVVGAGPGGGPHVRVIQYDAKKFLYEDVASFFAYDAKFTGGVRVAGLEPSELPCGSTSLPGVGCVDGSDATSTTAGPTTTVKPTTTTTAGGTTTTAAACDTVALPGLGCLGGSSESTTTTVKPTTTTAKPTTTTSSTSTSTSTTSSTTSTTAPVPPQTG